MINFSIHIKGKVHGVFFRASAKREAERLGLTGYICNKADGSVHAEVEGEQPQIDEFILWCKSGPPQATVTNIQSQKGELKNFKTFDIRHSE
jgi:acylphosphatase